jgi:hypothetical protein
MEFDRKEFKRKFPNLSRELEKPEEQVSKQLGAQDEKPSLIGGYAPEIISYLRRALTNNQALEIIGYLKKRGEISEDQANALKRQIEEKGVRSFGRVRVWGDYERKLRSRQSLDGEVDEDDNGLD